jgi:predicted nuclease with RNAse H fold
VEAAPIVIGIDIAAARPCVAVALRCGRTLDAHEWHEADEREPGDRGRLLDWIADLGPAVIGIDAPQRPKRGWPGDLHRPRDCDAELLHRRISVYQVPTRAEAEVMGRHYAWMQTGWSYFRDLARRGYEPPAPGALPGELGQEPAVLEVYPHAAFVTVLGGTPPPKSTRQGLRLRVLTLRRLGLRWDEYYDHDSLDALMAAFVAWRFVQGLATPLGDGRDGSIWLPITSTELHDKYTPLRPSEAQAALSCLASPTSRSC